MFLCKLQRSFLFLVVGVVSLKEVASEEIGGQAGRQADGENDVDFTIGAEVHQNLGG